MRRMALALLLGLAATAFAESRLVRVEVRATPSIAVRLALSAPVEPLVRTLPASDALPPRIYLDLPATVLGAGVARLAPGAAPLQRVRVGQFDPETARVVLDLDAPRPYTVRREAAGIVVEVDGGPAVVADDAPAASRPSSTPSESPPSPLPPRMGPAGRMLVVIDPGHGGRDPGATGLDGMVEKTLTLDLARRLASRLPTRLLVDVLLTRRDDAFVSIDARIAAASRAALFLSLHANAATDPRLHGIEVFFGGGGPARAVSGAAPPLRLGLAVVEALEQRLGDVRTLVRPGDYGVLARNAVPSVLLEVGYLTNPADAARLRDEAYRDLVTDAVIDAVDTFLHERLAS